jgi:hypothetical protein
METLSSTGESIAGRWARAIQRLTNQLRILFSGFPRLRDAFDPDALPISFILRQGARRSGESRARDDRLSRSNFKAHRYGGAHRIDRRPEARSTLRPGQGDSLEGSDNSLRRYLSGARNSDQ